MTAYHQRLQAGHYTPAKPKTEASAATPAKPKPKRAKK